MARKTTQYYFLEPITRYFVLFYYCILLVVGNDVMPSNMDEFVFCTVFLFFGAFLEAYVIGGITAEMQKIVDKNFKFEKKVEFMKFSMEIHHFPDLVRKQVMQYMNRHNDCKECSGDFERFVDFLNPSQVYDVKSGFYFDKMKNFWVFNKSSPVEIMFIAQFMKP